MRLVIATGLIAVAACAAFVVPAVPASAEDQTPSVSQLDEDVKSIEALLEQGGHKYRLKLDGGREMFGVVRSKHTFEIRGRSNVWSPATRDQDGAGIRLWYVKGQGNYLFLPAKRITKLEDRGVVTAADVMQIKADVRERYARAERERRELELRLKREAEERALREAAEAEIEATETKEAESAEKAAEAKEFKELLTKFPPTTWKPERKDEIRRKRVVNGIFPTDEEQDFLKHYNRWLAANLWWMKQFTEISAAEKAAAEKKDQKSGDAKSDSTEKSDPKPAGAGGAAK